MKKKLQNRLDLYIEYLRDLEDIQTKKFEESMDIQTSWAMNYLNNQDDCYTWLPLKYKTKEIGFVIISTQPNCHPNADYCICHAFVQNQYRNIGLFSDTLTNFIQNHPGNYCLTIPNNYKITKDIYNHIFRDILHYQTYSLPKISSTMQYQIAYKPKRK